MQKELSDLKKRRELKEKISDIITKAASPHSVVEEYDTTVHRLAVISNYHLAMKQIRSLLTKYGIKFTKQSQMYPSAEMKYLLQRTSNSVYKLQGMVAVAIEKSKTREDITRYFSAVMSFDYLNYDYKDLSTDVLVGLPR